MPDLNETNATVDEHVEKYGVTAEEAENARAKHERKAAENPEQVAYEAGRAAADDPNARRSGAEACPFSPVDHRSERTAWFQGLGDALNEQPTADELRAAVEEETRDA